MPAQDRSHRSRPDPYAPAVRPRKGREIAADAYQADCEQRGVEPDWNSWNLSMGITPLPERKRR